ncbi:hypothetical protein MRB53_030353 [Persea americana]|uniref:Uncharacterized protein n=1 Tax=Persea americana TaxID=3435 RepID=A0ACC2KLH7_PERAE|nr:hypothetical protein MRB53_030353 [Persea americana]
MGTDDAGSSSFSSVSDGQPSLNRVWILLASSSQPHRLRRRPAILSPAAANLSFPSLSSSSPSVLQIEV